MPSFEELVRIRRWLMELGVVELKGFATDGQPLWGLSKLGEEAGTEIVRAALLQGGRPS
jgi:hypothetical protein